jgi:predicted transcriptional regulator
MKELTYNYSRAQITNLPRKRRKLNKLIDRIKKERAGKNRPAVVYSLGVEFNRRFKYLTKGTKAPATV